MLRALAKTAFARALSWTGADRALRRLVDPGALPLVTAYHRVVEDFSHSLETSLPAMLISSRMLERHLDWVGQRYHFASLEEIGSRLEHDPSSGAHLAAVTFDDGYSDIYENAFPILKRKGIPAAIFVVTDLVGTCEMQTYDKLYLLLRSAYSTRRLTPRGLTNLLANLHLPWPNDASPESIPAKPQEAVRALLKVLPQSGIHRLNTALESEASLNADTIAAFRPVSWEMLASMQAAGITIGSHTRTHPLLTNESAATVLQEAAGSRSLLEGRLGVEVRHFAYPDGRFDPDVIAAVASSGYRFGYTICGHRDPNHPLLTIPRRVLWENSCLDAAGRFSPEILSCQVNSIFDLVTPCRQDHFRGPARWAKRGGEFRQAAVTPAAIRDLSPRP